jgi:2,3,4,5-tetrahydropyridine-2-carboxylate N-succinyltransferase
VTPVSATDELRATLESFSASDAPPRDAARAAVLDLLAALERGEVRAAEPCDGGWRVNDWVKRGILLGFRVGSDVESHLATAFHFRDRESFPALDVPSTWPGVRVVPGGTTVRRGAFLSAGVVIMPPAYVNVGAWVGERTMIDSHALVGSCAQVGARVHLSAAAQIGGVLEPVGAMPVVVEDEVFVGGGCGVYEGTRVRRRAVLAPGVILSRSVPLYDAVRGEVHRGDATLPLEVPEGAVVVPGSRRAGGEWARRQGLQLYAPVIVKYRDASTDAAAALEEALR